MLACLFFDESQQPTCPQVRQRRRCTHLSPVFRQSSQPRACGVTSRIWLRCVHAFAISLFSPSSSKTIFLVGLFNTLILFIESRINCSSCDDVLVPLYNVTPTCASSSVAARSVGTEQTGGARHTDYSACPCRAKSNPEHWRESTESSLIVGGQAQDTVPNPLPSFLKKENSRANALPD